MAGDPCESELEVLRMIAGIDPWQPWGSWIGACIEFLQDDGYVSGGIGNLHLTEKGKECLAKFS